VLDTYQKQIRVTPTLAFKSLTNEDFRFEYLILN